jgi:RNA polymerase sigma factor (sigma-70 family)
VLSDQHLVDDAFQATFLVLIRKAGSIRKRELLANWLYGVAYRAASKAKVAAARPRARDNAVASKHGTDALADISARELFAALDAELSTLPSQYQGPLILCYLEGKTRDEAAKQFGWSLATLARRLERGRELLRRRLTRRGLGLPMALLPIMLSQGNASASVPRVLADATLQAAAVAAGGKGAAGVISASVAALTEGLLTTMCVSKLKIVATALVVVGLLGAGVGGKVVVSATSAGQAQVAQAQPEANPQNPSTRIAAPFPEKAVADKDHPEDDTLKTRIEQYERAFRVQTEIETRRSEKTLLMLNEEELLRVQRDAHSRLLEEAQSLPFLQQDRKLRQALFDDRNKKLRDGLLAEGFQDAFVDFLGRSPRPDQVKRFLEDKSANKQKRALGQLMALRMIEKGTDFEPTLLKKYVRIEDSESLESVIREGIEFGKLRLHHATKTLQEHKDDKSARYIAADIERTARALRVLLSLSEHKK